MSSRLRKHLLLTCAVWSAAFTIFVLAHLFGGAAPESLVRQLGFWLWPVLAINSLGSAVVILEMLAFVSPRVERLLQSFYWGCVAPSWIGVFVIAIAAVRGAAA